MNISHINFGKKIPISPCALRNLETNKPIEAICYEYDCKDLLDIQDVQNLDSSWTFRDLFSHGMQKKFIHQKIGKDNGFHFYCIKSPNDETLGLCKTEEKSDSIEIKLINSKKNNRYKYVGQNMLAIIAKKILATNRDKMIVKTAIKNAYEFYEKVCGFKVTNPTIYSQDYEIKKEEIPEFISLVEHRTQSI